MTSPSARPAPAGPYEPTDALVVRAPLLPVPGHDAAELAAAPLNPLVRNAIHAASESLGQAIDASSGGEPPAAVAAALLRYRIRMSTRPTPYGLFAAAGLARWGEATDLRIAAGPRPRRTRPDMGWLAGWVLALEADPVVRAQARLVANTSAFERGGRLHLADRGTGGRAGLPDVSVRATGAVRRALALARGPIDHATLVAELLAGTDGATPDRVAGLVDELCRLDLLLSDLRPALTGDPIRSVLDRLSDLPATRDAAGELAAALDALRALDRSAPDDAGYPVALRTARARLRALHDPTPGGTGGGTDVVQVDAALPLAGETVSRRVADDAARAVGLLLRLHPAPGGPAYLAGYRADFLARYGHDRRVPLLELLDPRFGLGPPGGGRAIPGGAPEGPAGHHGHGREGLLRELAATALRDGAREVVLTGEDLDALSTWTPDPARLATSLELSAFLAAADRDALDRGDYRLVVGPNLGGHAAGRGLGRFADLLGAGARDVLERIADAEDAHCGGPPSGRTVTAELVYLPTRHRTANVTVRPAVRRYEIPVGVAPGVPADRVIAPDRLAVGIRDGRLRLWWPDGGCEVRVAAGHMLNTMGAPAVCRFLSEIGQDGVTTLTGFDWGSVAGQPFLPRVRVGRIVLRPAQWQWPRDRLRRLLDADGAGFDAALAGWREAWRVPRQVYLAAGDNRLLLDLADPAHADLLRADLRRRGGTVLLQEGLPGTEEAWLPGPGGQYVSELVIPMVLRASADERSGAVRTTAVAAGTTAVTAAFTAGTAAVTATGPAADDEAQRLRPPGSDWLYVKLYGPAIGADAVVTGPVRRLAAELLGAGHAGGWFFLRYADPDPHLRLRLHGAPDRLLAEALPRLATWAAGLVASGARTRFTIETYERELERYGGPAGTELAEATFMADSTAVADLLALLEPDGGTPRLELAVLSTDTLLGALGMDAAGRLAWCSAVAPPPRTSGAAYREHKEALRALLGGPADAQFEPVLRALSETVAPLAGTLATLHATGTATLSVTEVAHSLVHLHANRLGLDRDTERLVVGLLRRTLASLAIAPVRAGSSRLIAHPHQTDVRTPRTRSVRRSDPPAGSERLTRPG